MLAPIPTPLVCPGAVLTFLRLPGESLIEIKVFRKARVYRYKMETFSQWGNDGTPGFSVA